MELAVVIVSMFLLFTAPAQYFVAATFVSTSCMMAAAFASGAFRGRWKAPLRGIALGLATAAVLYAIFALGAVAIDALHPFGVTSASESSIYALIASPSNPLYLQVAVLLFDSVGYESFFRVVLQNRLQARLGVVAPFAVALLDAGLHAVSLNPIWVGGTLVTDIVWGLTYYYGKGARASFTSHFVWDLVIFVIRPVM